MRIYRITSEKHLESYNGLGASYLDGARWNNKGYPVMYFAMSASVAMLEMANYYPLPKFIPKNFILGIYEIPDQLLAQFDLSLLPDDWNVYPYPSSTRKLGSEWLDLNLNAGLIVPSAATPDGLESIIVVNARHPGAEQIKLIDKKLKLFNERSFVGRKD
tara:strand:+ start:656 stop:1135 length:480 start_codon:yes stop_codon:yes gene_type:complete